MKDRQIETKCSIVACLPIGPELIQRSRFKLKQAYEKLVEKKVIQSEKYKFFYDTDLNQFSSSMTKMKCQHLISGQIWYLKGILRQCLAWKV